MNKQRQSGAIDNKALATAALMAALALIFSYIEAIIPINLGFPGIKIGFANIVVLMALYYLGPRYAFMINVLRIVVAALLFGSVFSGLYALAGGVFSFLVMLALKKTDIFSITAVSMAGGAAHNMAQLAVAMAIVKTPQIALYLPVLLLTGAAAGIFSGIVCNLVLRKIK